MGRRRLYHTAQDKLAANRAKSKRSYDKRKDLINKKRRKTYAEACKETSQVQTESQSNSTLSTSTDAQPVNIWMERAGRIASRLHRITGKNSINFLHRVVDEYLKSQDKDSVYEHVVMVGKLQKSIYRYENEVLTLAGVGPEYEKVKTVTRLVCEVVQWLEEVLCSAMVDAAGVGVTYQERGFSFQRATQTQSL